MCFSAPPTLKGFFSADEVETSFCRDELLLGIVFFGFRCVNNCRICCYSEKRKLDFQPSEYNYKYLIDEMLSVNIKTILVPGYGEPTIGELGKLLIDFIRYANDKGIYVIIISSLNPEPLIIKDLIYHDVSIIAKLESFNPLIFNNIVRPKVPYRFVDYNGFMIPKGLLILLENGLTKDNRLGCGTVVNRFNLAEIESIYRFYRDNNIFPYMQCCAELGNAINDRTLFSEICYNDLLEKLLKIDKYEYGLSWTIQGSFVAFKFHFPGVIIDSQGYVQFYHKKACQIGKLDIFGSAKTGKLKTLIDSNSTPKSRFIHF